MSLVSNLIVCLTKVDAHGQIKKKKKKTLTLQRAVPTYAFVYMCVAGDGDESANGMKVCEFLKRESHVRLPWAVLFSMLVINW